MAHALHKRVQELPLPLAVLAGRALGSRRGRDRHDAAYYLCEATLKLAAAARIGRWLDVAWAPDSALAERLEVLVLPSLGHWCGLLRDVAAELARAPRHAFDATGGLLLEPLGTPSLAALARAVREAALCDPQLATQAQKRGRLGFFELLVAYRNELIGHGAQRDAELYESLAGLLLDAVVDVLAGDALFGGLRLGVAHLAVSASRRAAAFRFTDLTGLVPLPLDGDVEGEEPERLYLVGEAVRVPLHPLVVCSDDERGQVRTGFLNRAFSAGDGGVRRADYVDYLSGRALADKNALDGLAELLAKLRGAPVDVDTLSTIASRIDDDPATPPPAGDEALGAGVRLGHYELERLLGAGAMGRVYAARDTRLGREVALKLLPPELAAHPDRRRRLEREARAVAKLAHPNVVTLHAFEEAGGRSFLVMERVSGERLGARVVAGGLPFAELCAIAVPLADAVATAHEHGVLHRDLKPDNVMLTASGSLKVLDFGLAKLFVEGLGVGGLETQEGRLLGTPAYMSPEQAEGAPVDARSDIFSLGVVLFELATGQRPFEGESAMRVVSAVLSAPAPDLARLRPDLPARFVRIVSRCLSKDRSRRYQSARDLATDLAELSADLAPQETPARRGRRRVAVAVAFATGAALAAAVALVAWRASGPREPAPALATPSATAVPVAATRAPPAMHFRRLTAAPGLERTPELAPDGSWFVYAAGAPGELDVFRQRVGGLNPTNLTPDTPGQDFQPAISSDGTRIAFVSEREGGGVFVMGATGESLRRVTPSGFHPRFSPDGTALVVSSQLVADPRSRGTLGAVSLVDLESGAVTPLPAVRDAAEGAFSPDGRWIVADGDLDLAQHGLLVIPAAGQASPPRLLFDRGAHVAWTPAFSPDGRSVYFASTASGSMNIWRLPVDPESATATGAAEPVTSGVAGTAQHPSLSRDGKRLLFSSTLRTGNLARVAFDPERGRVTSSPTLVTRGANAFSTPDVSPDGASVVFCSCWVRPDVDENIYVARADGSGLRALTDDTGKSNRLPRWTSDGARVVFYSNRGGSWQVWSVAPDGSGLGPLTPASERVMLFTIPEHRALRAMSWVNMRGMQELDLRDTGALAALPAVAPYPEGGHQFVPSDFSPDDAALAGWIGVGGRSAGVHRWDVASRRYTRITESGVAPRWLPDGRRLVYSDGSGRELWLVDGARPAPERIFGLDGDALGDHIALSPDGRWLYFTWVTEDGDVWLGEVP